MVNVAVFADTVGLISMRRPTFAIGGVTLISTLLPKTEHLLHVCYFSFELRVEELRETTVSRSLTDEQHVLFFDEQGASRNLNFIPESHNRQTLLRELHSY